MNKEACCSLKEPAITPNGIEALDNAQYMQSNEVDSYYFDFNSKCYACFLFVKSVDMLVNKRHMEMCFEMFCENEAELFGAYCKNSSKTL